MLHERWGVTDTRYNPILGAPIYYKYRKKQVHTKPLGLIETQIFGIQQTKWELYLDIAL